MHSLAVQAGFYSHLDECWPIMQETLHSRTSNLGLHCLLSDACIETLKHRLCFQKVDAFCKGTLNFRLKFGV